MIRPQALGTLLIEFKEAVLGRFRNITKRIPAVDLCLVLLLGLCNVSGVNAQPATNVALAANGAVASASSTYTNFYPASAVNNGDRAGHNNGFGGVWKDATLQSFPDWVQIDFNGAQTIDHVIVYSVQDNDTNPVEPSDTLTFTQRGITAFTVQSWNGTAWVSLGSVTGNNLVKRTVSFSPTNTSKIRVLVNGVSNGRYSLVAEIEAWTVAGAPPSPSTTTLASSANPSTAGTGVTFTASVTGLAPTGSVNFIDGSSAIAGCAAVALSGGSAQCSTSALTQGTHSIVASYSGDANNAASQSALLSQVVNGSGGGGTSINVALVSNGAVASASSSYSSLYPVSAVNNGDRAGRNFGAGGVWKDATLQSFPDWVQIDFNGAQTIDHVIVYSVQDNDTNPVEPSDTLTFTQRGITAFTVQSWNGSAWVSLGSVTGNNLVKRTVSFSPTNTSKIRVLVNGISNGRYSLVAEIEAWTSNPDQPPAVTLTNPPDSSVYAAPASIPITATATDSDGTISKVEFYQNGGLLGTVPTGGAGNVGSSYSFTWTSVPGGTYAITAKAYDNLGATTSSGAVNVTVCGSPLVTITSPLSGQTTLPPGTFALAVGASTPAVCGSVTQVEYYAGAMLIATSTTAPSFGASWSNVSAGRYDLTAKAYATNGMTATSAAVTVTVNTPPAVTLTAPVGNAQLTTPGPFTLTAAASDPDAGGSIAQVDFLANGVVVGTKTAAPYAYNWSGAAGSYTLAARATDNLGGVTTSPAVPVVVANPPTVTIAAPPAGQMVVPGTQVTVTANPAPDSAHGRGVGSVILAARNSGGTQVWSATTTGPSYTATWTPTVADIYTLTATVTDTGGATGVSPGVALTADRAPAVSATSDRGSYPTPATVHLTATATDADGTVQNVAFYANGSSLGAGTAAGANTFTLTWLTNTPGTYAVTAKATDNLGGSTTSAPLTVTIVQSGPRTVYYHNDFEGSPLAATDDQRQVVWLETYAPYGERYLNQDTVTRNGLWYNGKPTEDSSGLSYYGGRWYNPTMGRFYSVDPQRFRDDNPLSFNRYAYANNNPYRFIDPNGSEPSELNEMATGGRGAGWRLEVERARTTYYDLRNNREGLTGYEGSGVRYGPANPGPLPLKVAETFRGGSYTELTLNEPTIFYRAYGGQAQKLGAFWSRVRPTGPLQAQLDLAIKPEWGNKATEIATIRVPAGQTIYEGAAASQGALVGGGNQVYIPTIEPSWVQP